MSTLPSRESSSGQALRMLAQCVKIVGMQPQLQLPAAGGQLERFGDQSERDLGRALDLAANHASGDFGGDVHRGALPMGKPLGFRRGDAFDGGAEGGQQRVQALADTLVQDLLGREQRGDAALFLGAAANLVGVLVGFGQNVGGLSPHSGDLPGRARQLVEPKCRGAPARASSLALMIVDMIAFPKGEYRIACSRPFLDRHAQLAARDGCDLARFFQFVR